MNQKRKSKIVSFAAIYGIVMAIDLLIYLLIFHAGKAIPPASPHTSFPGNYGLIIHWIQAHYPAAMLFFKFRTLSDSLLWLLILQDIWLAALIYLWRRRRAATGGVSCKISANE